MNLSRQIADAPPAQWLGAWGMIGILLALLIGQLRADDIAPTGPPVAGSAPVPAIVIQLEDEINDYTRDDLIRRFEQARRQGAKAVILDINSYGGGAIQGLETSRYIKQQKDLQVAAYVKEKAISAGSLIAASCGSIWMAPHSFVGDCGVISVGPDGLKELGPLERAKFESPVVEDFRDSAQRNGYSPLLLEAMVQLNREIYFIKDKDDQRRIVGKDEYEKLSKEGWTPVFPDRNPLNAATALLTLNADTAVAVGLSRGIVNSPDDVARKMNWTIIDRYDRSLGDRVIALLSSSAVRGLLMSALIVCIYLAFKIPGLGIAEAGIAIILALLLGIPFMTGYAQWWEIILVLLGVALIALEIFVIPGFGVAGIAGTACILIGLIFTFVPKEPVHLPGYLPVFKSTWDGLRTGLLTTIFSMSAGLAVIGLIARHLPSMPLFGRLVLTRTVGGGTSDGKSSHEPAGAVATTTWLAPGQRGKALCDLCPGGVALFPNPDGGEGRTADVIGDSGFIPADSDIVVHAIRGAEVIVRRVPPEA